VVGGDVPLRPDPATTDVELDAAGSKPTGLSASDGQVVLNLPAGAVAPHPDDTKVALTVTALDPATLGGLPGGLRANGNAYRIQAAYQPSGTAVDSFAQAGNLVLGVPEPFRVLVSSVDGRSWEQLPPSQSGLPTADSRIGYFLGTVESSVTPPTPRGSAGNGGVTVVVLVVVLALAFGLVPVIYLRRRRRAPPRRHDDRVPGPGRPDGGRTRRTRRSDRRGGDDPQRPPSCGATQEQNCAHHGAQKCRRIQLAQVGRTTSSALLVGSHP